jgi:hypothetical protein
MMGGDFVVPKNAAVFNGHLASENIADSFFDEIMNP